MKSISAAFFLILLTSISTQAQTTNDLLGKSLNSPEVQQFIATHSNNQEPKEILQANIKTYTIDCKAGGVSLEFNANMALYRVVMYDSGYTYQEYKGQIPKNLKWGMTESEIVEKIGALEEVRTNQFKKLYTMEDYALEFYFNDGKLSLLKTVASYSKLMATNAEATASWGFRLLPDGIKIEGNVVDGIGTMRWGKNAALYKGEWAYGLPHGTGEYVDSLGNKYQGEFKLGFFWGEGDFYSKHYAYSYKGDYMMGKRHGVGQIAYSNKTAYKGDWFADDMRGTGTYVMNADFYYEGEMSNNSFNGKGILYTPDGYIEGTFKDGKPHGFCKQVAEASQQTLEGEFVNGKKNGKFKFTIFGAESYKTYENDIEIERAKID
jgi:hypothetical protein